MNPAKNADEPTFGQGFVTGLWNNGASIVVAVVVVAAGAAVVAVAVPVAVVTAPVVVGGGVVAAAGAAAYGGYQTGLAASQLGTGAEVNQLGVPTGRQLTPAELGEKAADVTVGGAMIGAGAASALRGRWAAQAAAGAEAQGAAGTWRSWLFRRKAPSKPGPQGNKAPANPSEPASYGGENPDPWTPPLGSSQSGGSPASGPASGAGAGSNAGVGQKGSIPQKASDALKTIRQTNAAPKGHKGGVTFANDGRGGGQVLPKLDSSGKPINYQEFDVSPFQKGVNRGAERIVTGSDGKASFTNDHYRTFIEIP